MKRAAITSRLRRWLNNLPIQDPIERPIASLLQVVLIGLIVVVILATIIIVSIPTLSIQEKVNGIRSNLIGFLVVALPLSLLRRGYFRGSALIVIIVLFITPTLAVTVAFDLLNSGGILFQFTLAIILAGLLVSRRALALTFGLSAAVVGFAASRGQNPTSQLAMVANFILFNGLIALFVDRFGITLRTALTDALEHESELQSEMAERKRAEKKIERQNQRLKVLREIDLAILAADSLENIVGAALSHIRELIDCRRASISLFYWGTNEAVIFNVSMTGETSIPKGTRMPLALFQDMIQTLSKNQLVLINDLSALADPPPQIQSHITNGLHSMCLLPLFSQNSLIGSFSLFSEIPDFFDEEKINLGREVANQIAIAITQSNLLKELRDLNAKLEERVVERTAQLQTSNKELESFSYSVSHDLRAPLRAISGFSEALNDEYADVLGEDGKHYLTRIQGNTRRMGQLIDDLLSLASITRRELKQQDVDLSKLAGEIADELRAQEPQRRVEFEIEEQARARGDAGLLKIVLANLLGNAWKFTSALAEAKIQFGVLDQTPLSQDENGEKRQGEKVFFVRDNGAGFNMTYANKLFGAFQRLHSVAEFPGTGIGLATVQRIIHRHGGRIWAEAEVDKGAAFFFVFGGSHEL
jgi:signal transduction histidine kinase